MHEPSHAGYSILGQLRSIGRRRKLSVADPKNLASDFRCRLGTGALSSLGLLLIHPDSVDIAQDLAQPLDRNRSASPGLIGCLLSDLSDRSQALLLASLPLPANRFGSRSLESLRRKREVVDLAHHYRHGFGSHLGEAILCDRSKDSALSVSITITPTLLPGCEPSFVSHVSASVRDS